MKRVVNICAGCLNIFVAVAIVVIGITQVGEANAKQRLSIISDEDRYCLAQNVFFEARNQNIDGQVAVAWVTLNRMEDSNFPNNICDVVKQSKRDSSGNVIRNKCQFSWYCDGKSDVIPSNAVAQRAWEDAKLITDVVLLDWAKFSASPVADATFYHANYVTPYWAKSFERVAVVGDHIFYENN